MADTQTQNTPEVQQVTVDDLSRKIQETTNELNQLKSGLNNLSFEELQQKASELSDIENTISECMDDLSSLEKDGSVSISKTQLDSLKSQIDTLTVSKETLKKQIEKQTTEALVKLNQTVTQESDQKNENGEDKGEKKGLSGWWSGLNKGQKWGVRIGGALAGLGILKLGKRIFGGKYDYEKEIPGYSSMTRKQRRLERKKLKQKKRAERKSQKGEFRERPFGKFVKGVGIFAGVGSGIYYLAHGIYTKNWGLNDLFDWKKGKKLKMEEALPLVEGEVNNGKTQEGMFKNNFDGIKYDEESKTIKSYGQEIKVDVKKRMVEGLDVKFNDLPELIHAANIINCLKYNLGGKSDAESPFSETSTGGDIQFKFSERGAKEVLSGSNSEFWTTLFTTLGIIGGAAGGGYIGGVVGAIGGGVGLGAGGYALGSSIDNDSTLGHACSTIKSGENFKRFIGYLNGVKRENGSSMWTPREQGEISQSPMQDVAQDAADRLSGYNVMDGLPDRCIDVKQDPQDSTRYEISSFTSKTYIKIEGGEIKDGKLNPDIIKSITIEKYSEYDRRPRKGDGNGIKLDFPHNKDGLIECIRTVDLINEMRSNWARQGAEKCSIYYRDTSATERARGALSKGLKIDTEGSGGDVIRSKEQLEKYYPTLLADLKKTEGKRSSTIERMIEEGHPGQSSDFLCFVNGMVDGNKQNFFQK